MRIPLIESSPRGSDSTSIGLTRDFLSACRSVQGSIEVDRLSAWDENLPESGRSAIDARYKALRHADMTPGEAAVWQRIQSLIERFRHAERIVVGCPM